MKRALASSSQCKLRNGFPGSFRLFLAVLVCILATVQLDSIRHLHKSSLDERSLDKNASSHVLSMDESKHFAAFQKVSDMEGKPNGTVVASNVSPLTEKESYHVALPKDYDLAAPKFVEGSGRCHFLPSMAHRQTPAELVTNFTYFVESRTTMYEKSLSAGENDTRPLFMYNPSLIPLSHIEQALRDEITGHDWDLRNNGVQAMYLASYRVSTVSNCLPDGGRPPVHWRNYLGLALLDEHLNVVEGTDIVTDANYKRRSTKFEVDKTTYYVPKQHSQDCRLFVMPAMSHSTKATNDSSVPTHALYMSCNSMLTPIAVHRSADDRIPSLEDLRRRCSKAQGLENLFGDGLRLSSLNTDYQISNSGKNYNIIRSDTLEYYLELWPGGPHEVARIDFKRGMPPDRSIASEAQEPNATWLLPENYTEFPFQGRDRGGGCCVEISHGNRVYYVGVSHTRSTSRGGAIHHRYMSRLYSFETAPPFAIVAKTGLFCLGYGKREESRGNAQVGFNDDTLLQITSTGGTTYNCPAISFVSGLSEHATNSSLVILSYGVKDCYPRMVSIEKAELVTLLFPR